MDKELLVKVLEEINDSDMEMEKIIALFNELNVGEIEEIIINGYDEIEVDGATYKILTDEEADEEFKSCQEGIFDDMGLSGYSESFQYWIKYNALDKDYFDDIVKESMESYIEDIEYDGEDRLLEEMKDAEVETEEEYLDYLIDNAGDSIEYVIDNYGYDYLDTLLNHNPWIIDLDAVIEEIKSWDGRGCIAYYDGEELELDDGYFAYRVG